MFSDYGLTWFIFGVGVLAMLASVFPDVGFEGMSVVSAVLVWAPLLLFSFYEDNKRAEEHKKFLDKLEQDRVKK